MAIRTSIQSQIHLRRSRVVPSPLHDGPSVPLLQVLDDLARHWVNEAVGINSASAPRRQKFCPTHLLDDICRTQGLHELYVRSQGLAYSCL